MKRIWIGFVVLAAMTPSLGQTLSQQKMCDEQAYLKFHREFEDAYDATKYISHFDPKANVCYVMFIGSGHAVGRKDKETVFARKEIEDAFEGTIYGEFFSTVCPDCRATECWVKPHGSDASVSCDSHADFLDQSNQFFGLARKYFGLKA